eukprot:11210955-Lingulodinium_polyedra.AAC.1
MQQFGCRSGEDSVAGSGHPSTPLRRKRSGATVAADRAATMFRPSSPPSILPSIPSSSARAVPKQCSA